jgi:aspartyl aminopeptidase
MTTLQACASQLRTTPAKFQSTNPKPSTPITRLFQANKEQGADARHAPQLLSIIAADIGCSIESIKDLDITLYDTVPGAIWGPGDEFLSSPRLDNQVKIPKPETSTLHP